MENKDIFVTATRNDCNPRRFANAYMYKTMDLPNGVSRYDLAHMTKFNDVTARKSQYRNFSNTFSSPIIPYI